MSDYLDRRPRSPHPLSLCCCQVTALSINAAPIGTPLNGASPVFGPQCSWAYRKYVRCTCATPSPSVASHLRCCIIGFASPLSTRVLVRRCQRTAWAQATASGRKGKIRTDVVFNTLCLERFCCFVGSVSLRRRQRGTSRPVARTAFVVTATVTARVVDTERGGRIGSRTIIHQSGFGVSSLPPCTYVQVGLRRRIARV